MAPSEPVQWRAGILAAFIEEQAMLARRFTIIALIMVVFAIGLIAIVERSHKPRGYGRIGQPACLFDHGPNCLARARQQTRRW